MDVSEEYGDERVAAAFAPAGEYDAVDGLALTVRDTSKNLRDRLRDETAWRDARF